MFNKIYDRFNSIIRYYRVHRNFTVHQDDIFLVSYAKSGNTWLRFLIGNLIYAKEGGINFGNFRTLMPDIYQTPKDTINQMKGPRFIKSHEHFNTLYPKVIYIQRNPKKIVTSYYTWYKNKNPNKNISFDDFFENFINGSLWNGCWKSHTTNWIKDSIQNPSRVHVLKYEDLVTNTFLELQKILSFLNMSYSDEEIQTAIEKSSMEKMKSDEKKYPHAIFKNSSSGFVGSKIHQDKLTKEHEETIEKAYGVY